MANKHYEKYGGKIQQGQINLLSDTIKATLCSSSYSRDLANHEFYSSVGAGARLSTATISTSKAVSASGAFSAGNITFTGITGTGTQIVLWKDTGTESTSPLIGNIDTATGLPTASLSGGTLTCTWDSGAAKIFRIKP